jgi:hypothetical protein
MGLADGAADRPTTRWCSHRGGVGSLMASDSTSAAGREPAAHLITDATFEKAKCYGIHDHVAIQDGPRHDGRSC